MNFIIKKDTLLFTALVSLCARIEQMDKQALDLVVSEFGDREYCGRSGTLAGGISAIQFKEGNPDKLLWKQVGEDYQRLFFPKVKHKDLLKKITALPAMEPKELNAILNYKSGIVPGTLSWSRHPGFHRTENFILIDMHDGHAGHYKPVEGMEEITATEYAKYYKTFQKEEDARTKTENNN